MAVPYYSSTALRNEAPVSSSCFSDFRTRGRALGSPRVHSNFALRGCRASHYFELQRQQLITVSFWFFDSSDFHFLVWTKILAFVEVRHCCDTLERR